MGQHAVERNRQLVAAALGVPPAAPCDYGLRAEGAPPLEMPAPYAVLLTMTSRADKLWPEERWVELARALAAPAILPWGSEEERTRAQRIAAALEQAEVPPRMGLEDLGRLFAGARAVIGVDTGLTHFAAALGVPTVGIYCGSDPALTGLYGAPRAANVGAIGRVPEAGEVVKRVVQILA
jgi:heptosyltransferase-1